MGETSPMPWYRIPIRNDRTKDIIKREYVPHHLPYKKEDKVNWGFAWIQTAKDKRWGVVEKEQIHNDITDSKRCLQDMKWRLKRTTLD